jgi:hypothetical protein
MQVLSITRNLRRSSREPLVRDWQVRRIVNVITSAYEKITAVRRSQISPADFAKHPSGK